jgi:geranylgeranyl pyrophosphate synthase
VSARATDPLAAIAELAGAPLRRGLEQVELRLREIAGKSAPARETIEAGGKRLRPLLVFVAGMGGQDATAELVRAAVAVELIHAATLVHDDVLDAAPLRRGRPTVFASGGRGAATATGDLLFSRAFAELARNDSAAQLAALSAASTALAEGELMQREDAWRVDVPVSRYMLRCELKTARLFEAAIELGRLATGGPPLGRFGVGIGLAFQLLDDVLDVSGPASRTGKRRGTDLLDGTVTLPLIMARERDPSLAALDLRDLRDAEALCDRIVESGALETARETALELVAEAKQALPARLQARQRQALLAIADGVVDRYA